MTYCCGLAKLVHCHLFDEISFQNLVFIVAASCPIGSIKFLNTAGCHLLEPLHGTIVLL